MTEAPFPSEKKKVLLTIECVHQPFVLADSSLTPAVCAEALASDVSVVIAYHPPVSPYPSTPHSLSNTFPDLPRPQVHDALEPPPVLAAAALRAGRERLCAAHEPGRDAERHQLLASLVHPRSADGRLVEPWKKMTATSAVITESERPPAGFEGAGMGRIITLQSGVKIEEAVESVKAHLGLKYGMCGGHCGSRSCYSPDRDARRGQVYPVDRGVCWLWRQRAFWRQGRSAHHRRDVPRT